MWNKFLCQTSQILSTYPRQRKESCKLMMFIARVKFFKCVLLQVNWLSLWKKHKQPNDWNSKVTNFKNQIIQPSGTLFHTKVYCIPQKGTNTTMGTKKLITTERAIKRRQGSKICKSTNRCENQENNSRVKGKLLIWPKELLHVWFDNKKQ